MMLFRDYRRLSRSSEDLLTRSVLIYRNFMELGLPQCDLIM